MDLSGIVGRPATVRPRKSGGGIVKRIMAGLALLLLAGCGIDWFPAVKPAFQNSSSALQNRSTARIGPAFANSSAAGR